MNKAKYVTDRTRAKTVRGLIAAADGRCGTTNIDVLLTVDEIGATLSLSAGEHVMLAITLEDVADMIKAVK